MPIYAITFGFIIFDVLTGFLKACHNNDVDSTRLREGLYHKSAEMLALIGSGLLEYACQYVQLGIELPMLGVVSVYICIMEFVSILENLCEVNPQLKTLFEPYLKKTKEKVDDK